MNPRSLRPLAGALALLLLVSGCFVRSEHPLSDPKNARPDPALVGQWRSTINKDEPVSRIRFDRDGFGCVDEKGADGRWKIAKRSEKFFVTRTAKARYLNAGGTDPKTGGYFLRYASSADGKTLTFWMPRLAVFRRAVVEGKLKGVIEKSDAAGSRKAASDERFDSVHLQDSPAAILTFLESQRTDDVFERLNVLRRIE